MANVIGNENMKSTNESRTAKATVVNPTHTNMHGTLFGGQLMAFIDDVALISATRHSRRPCVTASTDSVDFLHPINQGDIVCLESMVTWTHKTSMEVFVKAIAEKMFTGERHVAATALLTFVALDEEGNPVEVPGVYPETEEEKFLNETAFERKELRKGRKGESRKLAREFGTPKPWDASSYSHV